MFSIFNLLNIALITILIDLLPQISSLKSSEDQAVQRSNPISDKGPAAKCQDIYETNRESPSGYYDIKIKDQIIKVYCYFHNPKSTVIRQFNDIDGNPQEGNVYQPVPVGNGDPEGAMEMQLEEHEIPPGVGPHFTQQIIDEQEKMYWNKTFTIQSLIDSNNEKERKKKKQQQKQQKQLDGI